MSRYRHSLPQLSGDYFVTDGGLETDLIFHHGVELPCNAAYTLLATDAGVAQLDRYFDDYLAIARDHAAGLLLESATWRANPDWAQRIGTSAAELDRLNAKGIETLAAFRRRHDGEVSRLVISGCMGPRSDAYRPTHIMTPDEAQRYHSRQVAVFADTEADLLAAFTLTNVPEAIGIARAARAAGMPAVISFTLETDGCLPTGQALRQAIEEVDAATESAPLYYMINCVHPAHCGPSLMAGEPWTSRVRGLRANSSQKSHAELDESTELDEGNPSELGGQCRELRGKLPDLNVLGGCCGADYRHVRAIAAACVGRGQ